MKAILVNYNFTPTWLFDYDFDYLIYDRSDSKDYLKDFPQDRILYTENVGNVDLDKLSYLVDNYDNLPAVFLWGKSNLFKFITREEFDQVKDNQVFTPLLTQGHKIYSDRLGAVNYYQGGMYYERNDSWYLSEVYARNIQSFKDWARLFQLPNPTYIPFAPGGNYILTRDKVHLYGRDKYREMRDMLGYSQLPGEAQCAERSYHMLWSGTL